MLGNVQNSGIFIAYDHSGAWLINLHLCLYESIFFFPVKCKLSSLFNADTFFFAVCREDSYQSIVSCAAVVLTPVDTTVDTRKKEQMIMPDVSKQWVIQITSSFTNAI